MVDNSRQLTKQRSHSSQTHPGLQNSNLQATILFFLLLAGLLLVWELGVQLKLFSPVMPAASRTIADFWSWVIDPFYDNGPNDKGIGLHLLASLQRVMVGFVIGSALASGIRTIRRT